MGVGDGQSECEEAGSDEVDKGHYVFCLYQTFNVFM